MSIPSTVLHQNQMHRCSQLRVLVHCQFPGVYFQCTAGDEQVNILSTSSLVKSEPTWLCPVLKSEVLLLYKYSYIKQQYFLYSQGNLHLHFGSPLTIKSAQNLYKLDRPQQTVSTYLETLVMISFKCGTIFFISGQHACNKMRTHSSLSSEPLLLFFCTTTNNKSIFLVLLLSNKNNKSSALPHYF